MAAPVPGAIRRGTPPSRREPPFPTALRDRWAALAIPRTGVIRRLPDAIRRVATPPSRREPPSPIAFRDRRAALAISRGGYPQAVRRNPAGDNAAKPARIALSDCFLRSKGCFGNTAHGSYPQAARSNSAGGNAAEPAQSGGGRSSGRLVGWSISRIGRIAGGATALPRWFAGGPQRLGPGGPAGLSLALGCGCFVAAFLLMP